VLWRVGLIVSYFVQLNSTQVYYNLAARYSHLSASDTKQYNLVPAKRRWCSAAGEVNAGLAESNGSLPLGGWLPVTCRLTACTPGSVPGPTLGMEYGKAFVVGRPNSTINHDELQFTTSTKVHKMTYNKHKNIHSDIHNWGGTLRCGYCLIR